MYCELRAHAASDEVASEIQRPTYRDVLRVPDLDQADRWGWVWTGPGRPLRFVRRRNR